MKNEFILDREQQNAFNIVANTNTSLFITGAAGTGKSTFVRKIQNEISKNFLVLAPTGIAAINIGGQTIHSFFGFPMEVIGPRVKIEVSETKCDILERIDTIIVDEASMVRADLVDAMDRYLQQAFNTYLPFGGKQVVFVGDLFQLPPVIRYGTPDADLLHDMYGGGMPFFYKAKVLSRMNLLMIEFHKVYRQNDRKFLGILNRMRVGEIGQEDFDVLNSHVNKSSDICDYSVTLTASNQMAEIINMRKFEELNEEEFIYEGRVEGEFKTGMYPVPIKLQLKIGAQVIFCRNDYQGQYANGTIAIVTELKEDLIVVKLEDERTVSVDSVEWYCYEKTYNKESHKVESKVIGTYTQYPIKLAWAITVHKSQGMTFERMHLDLTHGMFAHGQAYVAISRMKSLDGLTLSHKMMISDILVSPEIKALSNSFNNSKMIDDEMAFGKEYYKYFSIKDYDNAAKVCMNHAIKKIEAGEYRNAALSFKKMFDSMLDDACLMNMTSKMELLKDSSITCNFLNAVICLYGNRYEEAVGYADLVLTQRQCLEALFIQGRAFYELKRYNEAYDSVFKLLSYSQDNDDNRVIDSKLSLFEAMVYDKVGNENVGILKKLLKRCPECVRAYTLLRKNAQKQDMQLDLDEKNSLIEAFNDKNVSEDGFFCLLHKANKKGKAFETFKKCIKKAFTK